MSTLEKNKDAPMGFMIRRPESEIIEHKSALLKPNSNFIMIVGTTGCGKSTALLMWLPCFSNKTKYLILASSKEQDDIYDSIQKYCKAAEINFQFTHDAETTEEAIQRVLSSKRPDEHMIVVFDDFNTNYTGRAEDPLNHVMIKVFSTLRSANCSAFAITQAYCNIPVKCRENCNIRMVFSLGAVSSVRMFFEEISGIFYDGGNQLALLKELKALYSQVRQTEHQFMLVLTHRPR